MLDHQERLFLWCVGDTEAVSPFKVHQGIRHRILTLDEQGTCHWDGIWQESLSDRILILHIINTCGVHGHISKPARWEPLSFWQRCTTMWPVPSHPSIKRFWEIGERTWARFAAVLLVGVMAIAQSRGNSSHSSNCCWSLKYLPPLTFEETIQWTSRGQK